MTDYSSLIIGLCEEKKSLEKLVLQFKNTGQGGSCLLSGRRFSGKSLVLENILKQHYGTDEDNTKIEKIDGQDYESFSTSSKIFERLGLTELVENYRRDEKSNASTSKKNSRNKTTWKNGEKIPKILFIVDHFENFTKKRNQTFLYSILNGCQTYPWFVLLIGISENCVSNLEKRVRSRLSKLRINFNVAYSFEEYRDAFFEFLNYSSLPEKLFEDEMDAFEGVLAKLHQRFNFSIGWLKRLIQLFELAYKKHPESSPARLLALCLEAILPENGQERILDGLSVRQLCLLNCCTKLEDHGHIERTYREIVIEYYRFVNEIAKFISMRVCDIVLFRDMDELLDQHLLVLTKKNKRVQIQFKKVTSNVEKDAIKLAMSKRKPSTPTPILKWFNCE